MADKKNPDDPKSPLQEDDIVARLKSAAGGELAGLTTYTGLLGRSSKEGYWLLYPTLDMNTCVEIQEADIVHSEPLPPEQSPFGGLGGTRIFVRKGAQVNTTRTISRTSQAGAGDEFDLDLRVGAPTSGLPHANTDGCPAELANKVTLIFSCGNTICPTCNTCPTNCGQPTCPNTQCNTCGLNTCANTYCERCNSQVGPCTQWPTWCITRCGTVCPGQTCPLSCGCPPL